MTKFFNLLLFFLIFFVLLSVYFPLPNIQPEKSFEVSRLLSKVYLLN